MVVWLKAVFLPHDVMSDISKKHKAFPSSRTCQRLKTKALWSFEMWGNDYPLMQQHRFLDKLNYQLKYLYFCSHIFKKRGARWHSWLRHRATSQKVAGSIPDGFAGIFY
jgi:hypothetical protein